MTPVKHRVRRNRTSIECVWVACICICCITTDIRKESGLYKENQKPKTSEIIRRINNALLLTSYYHFLPQTMNLELFDWRHEIVPRVPWKKNNKSQFCFNCLLNISPLHGIVWKQSSYKWLSYEDSKMFQIRFYSIWFTIAPNSFEPSQRI